MGLKDSIEEGSHQLPIIRKRRRICKGTVLVKLITPNKLSFCFLLDILFKSSQIHNLKELHIISRCKAVRVSIIILSFPPDPYITRSERGGNTESITFSRYLIKQNDAARTVYFEIKSESTSPTATW